MDDTEASQDGTQNMVAAQFVPVQPPPPPPPEPEPEPAPEPESENSNESKGLPELVRKYFSYVQWFTLYLSE